MFLAFDLGNTSIKAGVFDGQTLLLNTHLDHGDKPTKAKYRTWLLPIFHQYEIDTIAIASVHPHYANLLVSTLANITKIKPVRLLATHFSSLKIAIDQPKELGIDLVVDAVAATTISHQPVIIVDVGTATKIMAVNQQTFLGVAIAPGLLTSYKAIHQHAALIKKQTMIKPGEVFGKNTPQSLASGIILGHAALIEGLISRGLKQLKVPSCQVILTGGYAGLIVDHLSIPVTYEPNLSLKGIQQWQ